MSRLAGTVRAGYETDAGLVVVLLRRDGAVPGIVDHFVREAPGRWSFVVPPGTYALAAFADTNGDLTYDAGEPALAPAPETTFILGTGTTVRDIDLVIPRTGRVEVSGPVDIAALQARSAVDQLDLSLGQLTVAGEVTHLSDPRFRRENGKKGLWAPLDFTVDVGPGIYFLAEHDPDRIPILFVHGISGTPLDFAAIIEHLDTRRFEPWLAFYPSGARLDRIAERLEELLTRLCVEHGVPHLFVVAHSMGGLVARAMILGHEPGARGGRISLFVSISTPWGGHDAAAQGVERSPVVVWSWYDIAPGSPFLTELFYDETAQPTRHVRRRLPAGVEHHLIFGFQRNSRRHGPSGDRVVTVRSELLPEAQAEARRIYGFDEDHTGILRSAEVHHLLGRLLSVAAARAPKN